MTADLGPAIAREVESGERRWRSRLHAPIRQPRGRHAHGGDRFGRTQAGSETDQNELGQDGRRIEVRLDDGRYGTVTQLERADLDVGDRVIIRDDRVYILR